VSLCHKAYVFDAPVFAVELGPVLFQALLTGHLTELMAFVDAHRDQLTYPWEPTPLPPSWRTALERGDAQDIGDLALTKYYDAEEDCGLQEHWTDIEGQLPSEARAALLGTTFGPPQNLFDPGRMGAYFQDAAAVRQSIGALAKAASPEVALYREALTRAAHESRGLYVTF